MFSSALRESLVLVLEYNRPLHCLQLCLLPAGPTALAHTTFASSRTATTTSTGTAGCFCGREVMISQAAFIAVSHGLPTLPVLFQLTPGVECEADVALRSSSICFISGRVTGIFSW